MPQSRPDAAGARGAAVAVDDLVAREGTLEGSIRWGEAEGDDPLLLHAITLVLESLHVGAREIRDPLLRLHSLRLAVSSWAQLEGHSYELGNVVREITADGGSYPVYDGYGSLKLGDVYHDVAPTLLRFGPREGCALRLHLEARLSASDSPPSFAAADLALEAAVHIGAVQVTGDSGADDHPSPDEAAELAARLLDIDAYEPPVVRDECTVLHPRCFAP